MCLSKSPGLLANIWLMFLRIMNLISDLSQDNRDTKEGVTFYNIWSTMSLESMYSKYLIITFTAVNTTEGFMWDNLGKILSTTL